MPELTSPVGLKPTNGKCRGCEVCALACSLEHSGRSGLALARLRIDRDLDRYAHRIHVCRHCRDPKCFAACPETDAMWRNPQTGVVVIEPEFCTACGACQEACPFDVVIFDEHAHVYRKCDLCRHRDGGPLCAEVCPEQAIAVRRLSSGGG